MTSKLHAIGCGGTCPVLLSGFVASCEAEERAETVATGIAGVTEVYNRIDVV